MKKFLPVILIMIFALYCGKSSEEFKIKKKDPVKIIDDSALKEKETKPEITEIKFTSKKDTEHDLIVSPVVSKEDRDLEFNYKWFVNDTEIKGESTNRLHREFFKQDDWVYCIVKIEKTGEDFREHKSKLVRIKGSIPIVELSKIGSFDIPGVFTYKINARIPEHKEDDTEESIEDDFMATSEEEDESSAKLKFELISPLDRGIDLNTETGEITWIITQELVEELGSKAEIKFKVINPLGRSVKSSITLILKKVEKKEKEDIKIKTGTETD
ncbi:MAG: hypothetical protein ABFR36_09635 [Acidobacteriota bacterium]